MDRRLALAVLAACGRTEPPTDAAELDLTQTKIDQARAHIDKIFVLVKENRTFDHYFGDFPGANTSLVARTSQGRMPLTAKTGAMSAEGHTHAQAVTAWDGGRMDGWLSLPSSADRLSYYPGEAMGDPTYPYHQLAKSYALLDHFHTEMLGPSIPNHIAVVSGLAQVYDNCTGCTIGCEGSATAPIVCSAANRKPPRIAP